MKTTDHLVSIDDADLELAAGGHRKRTITIINPTPIAYAYAPVAPQMIAGSVPNATPYAYPQYPAQAMPFAGAPAAPAAPGYGMRLGTAI